MNIYTYGKVYTVSDSACLNQFMIIIISPVPVVKWSINYTWFISILVTPLLKRVKENNSFKGVVN